MNLSDKPLQALLYAGTALENFLSKQLAPVQEAIDSQFPQLSSFLTSLKSKHSENLPLMNPVHVLALTLAYLAVIFTGKHFMKKCSPVNMKAYSFMHNLFLMSLSGYMFFGIVSEAIMKNYTVFGNVVDHSASGIRMAQLVWLFYFSKIFEFNDTFIMMMKKNNHQISFLHLYHHSTIFVIWWLVVLWAPGGEAYFSAFLNSFIHVVMYGYYLCASLGIKQVSPIKKYITMMQMSQFTAMLIQAVYNISNDWGKEGAKTYPLMLSVVLFFYMQTMLGLFGNFFIQDRMRRKAAKAKTL